MIKYLIDIAVVLLLCSCQQGFKEEDLVGTYKSKSNANCYKNCIIEITSDSIFRDSCDCESLNFKSPWFVKKNHLYIVFTYYNTSLDIKRNKGGIQLLETLDDDLKIHYAALDY